MKESKAVASFASNTKNCNCNSVPLFKSEYFKIFRGMILILQNNKYVQSSLFTFYTSFALKHIFGNHFFTIQGTIVGQKCLAEMLKGNKSLNLHISNCPCSRRHGVLVICRQQMFLLFSFHASCMEGK